MDYKGHQIRINELTNSLNRTPKPFWANIQQSGWTVYETGQKKTANEALTLAKSIVDHRVRGR